MAGRRVVLHLLPLDVGRGAQRYAMSLRSILSNQDWEHRIVVCFTGEDRALEADDSLGVPQGPLRRAGLDPRVVLRLRRFVRDHPVDAVVAHGGEPFKYARLAVPHDLPLIYLRIGVSQEQMRSGLRQRLHTFLARRADLVAGVSHETLDDAEEVMGVPRDKLVLIPNGRDPHRYQEARTATPDRSGQPPHLIWVSHLTTGKRPDWFVQLVARLRGEGHELCATLVGDGPLDEELRAPARDAGIDMLGHRSDIPELLAGADIFCFTSGGESEGMPGVLIEAGMAGLATVSTNVPGASTVLDHGRTGFVVPSDDFDTYVSTVTDLITSEGLRTSIGAAALERCERDFTLEASASLFQKALEQVVTGG